MSVKKDFVMPILVLSLLCLLVSGALAVGNRFTQPVIEEAAAQRMEIARREIIPQADGFELVDIGSLHSEGGIPKTVSAAYRATNNTGFIFMTTTLGYGGEVKLICGINPEGKFIRAAVLAQTETKGFGTVVFDEPHAGQYSGRDKNGIENVAAISGATISSNALKKGIRDAFTAFEIISLSAQKNPDTGNGVVQ